jgi:hypothetical protein
MGKAMMPAVGYGVQRALDVWVPSTCVLLHAFHVRAGVLFGFELEAGLVLNRRDIVGLRLDVVVLVKCRPVHRLPILIDIVKVWPMKQGMTLLVPSVSSSPILECLTGCIMQPGHLHIHSRRHRVNLG